MPKLTMDMLRERYGALAIWLAALVLLAKKGLAAFVVEDGQGWAELAAMDSGYDVALVAVLAGLLYPLYRKFWPTGKVPPPEAPAEPDGEPEEPGP